MELHTLGHACLLVRTAGHAVLVDPGVFSPDVARRVGEVLDGDALAAVLITHAHADHVDPTALAALLGPDTQLHAEAGAAEALRGELPGHEPRVMTPGDLLEMGAFSVRVVGGAHALIHEDLPRIGNVGLLMDADGRTVFHPGDSYDVTPDGVDVLAVPLNAPWAAVRDTVDFIRAVAPGVAVPVHDALLRPERREIYLGHVRRLGGVDVHDFVEGGPLVLT